MFHTTADAFCYLPSADRISSGKMLVVQWLDSVFSVFREEDFATILLMIYSWFWFVDELKCADDLMVGTQKRWTHELLGNCQVSEQFRECSHFSIFRGLFSSGVRSFQSQRGFQLIQLIYVTFELLPSPLSLVIIEYLSKIHSSEQRNCH